MTEDDLREMIRASGKQKDFARRAGVSPARVSQFMKGHTGPGPQIIDALGVEISYRKIDACTSGLNVA